MFIQFLRLICSRSILLYWRLYILCYPKIFLFLNSKLFGGFIMFLKKLVKLFYVIFIIKCCLFFCFIQWNLIILLRLLILGNGTVQISMAGYWINVSLLCFIYLCLVFIYYFIKFPFLHLSCFSNFFIKFIINFTLFFIFSRFVISIVLYNSIGSFFLINTVYSLS